MVENKIIRKSILIYYKTPIKQVRYFIRSCKKEARKVARTLKYPKNSYKYEIFDIRYFEGEHHVEGLKINNIKTMMEEASVLRRYACYSFVIDGTYDKEGNVL